MLKAIVYDFDGVIVDSAEIKTEAFGEVFSAWPEHVETMVTFHLENVGLSRFVKFKHFYDTYLGEPYTDEIGAALSDRFSELVLSKIIAMPPVTGAVEFLERNMASGKLKTFIASGTPHEELLTIVDQKGLTPLFDEPCGSPRKKEEILDYLFEKYDLKPEECVFIGDANSDRKAAAAKGTAFILRRTAENKDLQAESKWVIDDFNGFESLLEEIEACL